MEHVKQHNTDAIIKVQTVRNSTNELALPHTSTRGKEWKDRVPRD